MFFITQFFACGLIIVTTIEDGIISIVIFGVCDEINNNRYCIDIIDRILCCCMIVFTYVCINQSINQISWETLSKKIDKVKV